MGDGARAGTFIPILPADSAAGNERGWKSARAVEALA